MIKIIISLNNDLFKIFELILKLIQIKCICNEYNMSIDFVLKLHNNNGGMFSKKKIKISYQ